MAASVVDIKEMVLVTPSEHTPSHVLPLSALDSQLFLRFTIEYLLIYRSGSNRFQTAGSLTAARVKDALSRSLVPYYPFAGRVRTRPDGVNLEVVCRGQGALFIEAIADDVSVSDFDRAPRYSMQWKDLLTVHVLDVLCGVPPLVVQLTWLANGDAAIGVGITHCICDGIGSAEFLNSFSELASGRRKHTELKPVWQRHLLDPNPIGRANYRNGYVPHPEFNRVQDLCGFVSRFAREPLSPTSVTFDRRSLMELKKIASATGQSGGSSYTSFEVLSAHVWRSWARSLELPASQTLKMLFSINVRNRVKPCLPVGFYGNGFVLGCALTSVKELTEKGLAHAVGLVRRAKERVTDEYVKSIVEVVSESRACPDPDLTGVLIVSQWSKLGLEKVDFGLGKPVHVGPVCCDRYCLFLPVHEHREAVKVMVAVPKSAVVKYEYLLKSPCT